MKKFVLFLLVILSLVLGGCIPYDTPEFKEISPSQTAFLIPMVGDTTQQGKLQSEESLAQMKVASKRIQIPHVWVQTGRQSVQGTYMNTMQLIIVERKPETREWTEDTGTGTTTKNEGITAESKESIGFMARMNATAQIDEADAVRFLFRYNNKTLAEIMDTELRPRIESKFVEECSTRSLEQILLDKSAIMDVVRKDAVDYFKDRGVTITMIGLKGEFSYLNPEIQKSIDAKFQSAQSVITQKNENERVVSKAKADADAKILEAEGIAEANKKIENSLTSNILTNKWIEKWNGTQPTTLFNGDGNAPLVTVPAVK